MKSQPSAPPIPDPYRTAGAQTSSNVNTALANAVLNNANEYGPLGNVKYTTGATTRVYDEQGNPHDIPQYDRTVSLSPGQQKLLDQQNAIGAQMNDLSSGQLDRLGNVLNQPVSFSGAPAARTSIDQYLPQFQTSFDAGGNINQNAPTTFANSGSIQRDIGPTDFSQDRQRVEDAYYSRLEPQLARDREALDSRLANQGVGLGSTAYNRAIDESNRTATDARMQAILKGGEEQSRLAKLALDQGQFRNAAQLQDYGQKLGRGTFAQSGISQNNAAQQQQYTQNQGRALFGNTWGQQNFSNREEAANFNNAARANWITEELQKRNQPINEISTLLKGGQVSMPQFAAYRPGQVNNTDIGNYINSAYNAANDQYKTQSGFNAATNAGLFGLGSALFGGLGGYLGKKT